MEVSLSYQERDALRYAAGYVTRHLHRQLQHSSHPQRTEIRLCLLDMIEAEISQEDSEDWVRSVDRGGLKYVNDMTYMMFVSMELEVRRHLRIGKASQVHKERHSNKTSEKVRMFFSTGV